MSADLWTGVKAAFSARPLGMPVPPNWIALAAIAMLGAISPGFWLIGAGLEAAYLLWLGTHPRFLKTLGGDPADAEAARWERQRQGLLVTLDRSGRERHGALELRCHEIVAQQQRIGADPDGVAAQAAGLAKLLWIHLRLLATRASIERVVDEASDGEMDRLAERAKRLDEQLARDGIADDLRRSLAGQLEIVQQRQAKQREAAGRLAFVDAELARILEQVALIRDQALLATDPQVVASRIDQIAGSLGGTSDWLAQQQRVFGQIEDLVSEPPPLRPPGTAAAEGPPAAGAAPVPPARPRMRQ